MRKLLRRLMWKPASQGLASDTVTTGCASTSTTIAVVWLKPETLTPLGRIARKMGLA